VVQVLGAEYILGCQFIDRQMLAIIPREKRVTLANGSVIPILQDSDPIPTLSQDTPRFRRSYRRRPRFALPR
jgi:hypothetical protein